MSYFYGWALSFRISDAPKSVLLQYRKASCLEASFLLICCRKVDKNTLSLVRVYYTIPTNFTAVKEIEKPKVGDQFEVLWVKFDFDETMWNDEAMWDIRYLLMGSKMDRFPGFPLELSQVRGKIYISRDGDSERKRRMGRD